MSILLWLIFLSNVWILLAGLGDFVKSARYQSVNVKSEQLTSPVHVGVKVTWLNNGLVLENEQNKVLISLDQSDSLQLSPTSRRTKDMPLSDHYDAVFGLYKMPSGYTILLAKEFRSVNYPSFDGVKFATSFEFIDVPFHRNNVLNASTVQQNAMFKIMLSSVLRRYHFYYSTGAYNILSTWQKNQHSHENSASTATECAYFWNQRAVQPFIASNVTSFVTKFCSMWSSSFQMTVQGQNLSYMLLARRSKLQQGPRYIKRGCNDNGHVANFVEIEQVLVREDGTANSSFVQVRGSIPVHWSQQDTWKLKPPIHLNGDISRDMLSADRHIRSLYDDYANIRDNRKIDGGSADIFSINLIDKKGSQGQLGQQWMTAMSFDQISSFNDSMQGLNRSEMTVADYAIGPAIMRYLWLDYHYKLKHEGVTSLRQLHRHLLPALIAARGGFYLSRGDGKRPVIEAQQNRLVRTNCVDCLDRTNVVQSLVARWALIQQIISVVGKTVSISSSSSLILPNKEWEKMFRSVWGDLGDHLSRLYAGSNAMKRDVTQMGVRTKRGMLDDAVSFLQRYVANNYWDTAYQRALDLLIYNNVGESGQWNITEFSTEGAATIMEVENFVGVENIPSLNTEEAQGDFKIDESEEDSSDDISIKQQWTDLDKLFPLSDSNLQELLKEKVSKVDELFQELMNDIKLTSNTFMNRQSKHEK